MSSAQTSGLLATVPLMCAWAMRASILSFPPWVPSECTAGVAAVAWRLPQPWFTDKASTVFHSQVRGPCMICFSPPNWLYHGPEYSLRKCTICTWKEHVFWASLVVQWLRVCLAMQTPAMIPSLVLEDPTCFRAAKPIRLNDWARELQRPKPA